MFVVKKLKRVKIRCDQYNSRIYMGNTEHKVNSKNSEVSRKNDCIIYE